MPLYYLPEKWWCAEGSRNPSAKLYRVYHEAEPMKLMAYTILDVGSKTLRLKTQAIDVDPAEIGDLIQSRFIPNPPSFTTLLEEYLWKTIKENRNPKTLASCFIRLNEIVLTIEQEKPDYGFAPEIAICPFIEEITRVDQEDFDLSYQGEVGIIQISGLPIHAEKLLERIFFEANRQAVEEMGARTPLHIVINQFPKTDKNESKP